MDGRSLLDIGRELAAGSTEAHWRSSVGRAYYALLHEVLGALGRWGFALPPRDKVHTFARLKFIYATDPDLKRIGLSPRIPRPAPQRGRLPNRDIGTVRVAEDCRFCLERRRISGRASRRNRGRSGAACGSRADYTAISPA